MIGWVLLTHHQKPPTCLLAELISLRDLLCYGKWRWNTIAPCQRFCVTKNFAPESYHMFLKLVNQSRFLYTTGLHKKWKKRKKQNTSGNHSRAVRASKTLDRGRGPEFESRCRQKCLRVGVWQTKHAHIDCMLVAEDHEPGIGIVWRVIFGNLRPQKKTFKCVNP